MTRKRLAIAATTLREARAALLPPDVVHRR